MRILLSCLALLLIATGLRAQATPIGFEESLIDTIDPPSDIEVFSTPVLLPGDRIFIRVSPTFGILRPRVRLIDQFGNEVAAAVPSLFIDMAQLEWEVPVGNGGIFNIVVSDIDSERTGTFCITLGRFNSPPEASVLGNNSSQIDTIACASSLASFKFTALQGALTELVVTPIFGILEPKLYVCHPNGDILAVDSVGFNDAVSITIPQQPQDQCLYVLVVDQEGDRTGVFSITHSVLSGPSLTAEIEAFPANGIVCAGQGATLTAIDNAPNPMYHWSGPDGFTSNQAAFSLSGLTPEQAGYYHVTVTDQSGCVLLTASQQIQVVDFEPIIQSLPASGLLCEEEGFSLSAANLDEDMYTFSWQGPGGELVSTGQTYSTVSAQPGQSGVYILTATDLNGCAEQASADITVHALPAVAIQPEPESAAVCEGDGFSLSAEASPGGLDYAWLGPGISSNEAVITIEEASLNQSGVYAITVTDENGCAQDDSQFVTVHPLPTVGITTSPFDSEVCEGAPFSFTVNTNAGEEVSYSWQGPGGFTSNQPSIGTDAAVIAQDGLYGLTITDGNGCSRTASANLTVFPLPTIATGIEPVDATVCAGDDFSITSTASGADIVSYDWDGPGGFDSDLPSFTVENAELGQSGAYTLEVEDINGCRQQAELMVTVISFVAGIQTLPGSGTVCEGASIELQPITDADSPIFQWAGPDGFSSNEEVVTLTNMSDEKAGNYVLRIRDKHGCTQTANALLVLAALPELEVTQENSTIFVSASGGVPPYTFTIAGGIFGEGLNFPGIIENVEADNYTISVEDANGCTNSTSAVVATHSVDPAEAWGLSIAPNPSSGLFQLHLQDLRALPLEMSVFDQAGRRVLQKTLNAQRAELDLSRLPAGLYLLRLSNRQQAGTANLLLSR